MARELLEGLDQESLILRTQGHERWTDVENRLNSKGYTLGWPPVLSSSTTLGEVLETRATGLRSSLYGDPADNCIAIEAVLANGQPVTSVLTPRSAAGPDWKHAVLGGQGESGRISNAFMRVYPQPELRLMTSFFFKDASHAVEALASLMFRGALPAVAILLPWDIRYQLLLSFEGGKSLTEARAAIAHRLCRAAGGLPGGEEPTRDWLETVRKSLAALAREGNEEQRANSSGSSSGRVSLRDDRENEKEENPGVRCIREATLEATGTWSVIADCMEAVRGYPRAHFFLARARHDRATLRIDAEDLTELQLDLMTDKLREVGGVPVSNQAATGPLVSELLAAAKTPECSLEQDKKME